MSENPLLGSDEYFARLYQIEEQHWWSRGMRAIAAGILDAHYRGERGLSILDAGCGTGIGLGWLAHFEPRRLVGIDIFPRALQFCQRRGGYALAQASALELPFADEAFDLVLCNDVIQHLPGDGADLTAFGEFWRVLSPGGCLFLRTHSDQGRRNASASEDHRLYHIDQLRDGLTQSGFRVLKATYANTLMSIVPTVKHYLKQKQVSHHLRQHHDHGLAIKLLPPHLSWLNTWLYREMKVEAWLLSHLPISSPFGQTIFCLARKPERG